MRICNIGNSYATNHICSKRTDSSFVANKNITKPISFSQNTQGITTDSFSSTTQTEPSKLCKTFQNFADKIIAKANKENEVADELQLYAQSIYNQSTEKLARNSIDDLDLKTAINRELYFEEQINQSIKRKTFFSLNGENPIIERIEEFSEEDGLNVFVFAQNGNIGEIICNKRTSEETNFEADKIFFFAGNKLNMVIKNILSRKDGSFSMKNTFKFVDGKLINSNKNFSRDKNYLTTSEYEAYFSDNKLTRINMNRKKSNHSDNISHIFFFKNGNPQILQKNYSRNALGEETVEKTYLLE